MDSYMNNIINSDLILNGILPFLNVKDSCQLSQVSSRYYYLTNHYWQYVCGPELAVAASSSSSTAKAAAATTAANTMMMMRRRQQQKTSSQVIHEALSRLRTPPNLALAIGTSSSESLVAAAGSTFGSRTRTTTLLPHYLPHDAVCLEAVAAGSVQTCCHHASSSGSSTANYSAAGNNSVIVESDSHTSLMLMNTSSLMNNNSNKNSNNNDDANSMHNNNKARVTPFCYDDNARNVHITFDMFLQQTFQSQQSQQQQDNNYNNYNYKVFIVYACGDAIDVDAFVTKLQRMYPDASIVGGICSRGSVSLPINGNHSHNFYNNDNNNNNLDSMHSFELMDLYRCLGGKIDDRRPQGVIMTKQDWIDSVRSLLRTRKYILTRVEDGIFGVGISIACSSSRSANTAAAVPIRTIVSRGVKSQLSSSDGHHHHRNHHGITQTAPPPKTPSYYVSDAQIYRPGDEGYMFRLPPAAGAANTNTGTADSALPAYHLIRQITDRDTGNSIPPSELYSVYGIPPMVGLQRRQPAAAAAATSATGGGGGGGGGGFELHVPNHMSSNLNSLVLIAASRDEEPYNGANIDFFNVDGPACVRDVKSKMQLLKHQTKDDEKVLGALMFSCVARGPTSSPFIREEMADANCFANAFPGIPCLGFYALGEIGPRALVASTQQLQHHNNRGTDGGGDDDMDEGPSSSFNSVFQTGNATVQGYTAVFALFIVPAVDKNAAASSSSSSVHQFDDSCESIQAFLKRRLHH